MPTCLSHQGLRRGNSRHAPWRSAPAVKPSSGLASLKVVVSIRYDLSVWYGRDMPRHDQLRRGDGHERAVSPRNPASRTARTLPAASILAFQRAAGNRVVVQRLFLHRRPERPDCPQDVRRSATGMEPRYGLPREAPVEAVRQNAHRAGQHQTQTEGTVAGRTGPRPDRDGQSMTEEDLKGKGGSWPTIGTIRA